VPSEWRLLGLQSGIEPRHFEDVHIENACERAQLRRVGPRLFGTQRMESRRGGLGLTRRPRRKHRDVRATVGTLTNSYSVTTPEWAAFRRSSIIVHVTRMEPLLNEQTTDAHVRSGACLRIEALRRCVRSYENNGSGHRSRN
jgi:hypothetical protein